MEPVKMNAEDRANIALVRSLRRTELLCLPPKRLIERTFGIVSDGEEYMVAFVVTKGRKQGTKSTPPEPMSDWGKYQLATMFAKWGDE